MNYYSVVEFPVVGKEETEVEVVPTLWLFENEKKCYWPTNKNADKVSKFVSNRTVPDDSWTIYDVLRVFGKYGKCIRTLHYRMKVISMGTTDNV